MGHTVTVDSASFWRGPTEEDLLLWMWPEGFFRHSLGGRLGHLTLKQRETFESTLSQWKAKVPVMGVLHNFMPRCVLGNAGRHWIALYRHLVQNSDGVIHLVMDRKDDDVQRKLGIIKMRHTRHTLGYKPFNWKQEEQRFTVL